MKFFKDILLKISAFPKWKIAVFAVLAAVSIGTVSLAAVAMYGYESLPEEMAAATVIEAAPVEEEPEEIPEEEPIEEPEEEIEEEPEEEELIEVSLTGTSIEKDLKIKIENQKKKLILGEHFYITVKSEKDGTAKEYDDHDKDGIIYIKEIAAGNYTVTLKELESENYVIKNGTITVAVKDKIEYKKVDVTAEIKTESQVNTAVEDTAINDIPVESTLTDTLPLLESKISTSTVEKKDVDMSNFTKAWANSKTNTQTLKLAVTTVTTPDTDKPSAGDNVGTGGSTGGSGDNTGTGGSTGESGDNTGTDGSTGDTSGGTTDTPNTDNTDQTGGSTTGDGSTAGGESSGSDGTATSDPQTETTPASDSQQDVIPASDEGVLMTIARSLWNRLDNAFSIQVRAAQAAAVTGEKTATISLPVEVTLYNCDNGASGTYNLTLGVSGESSIIRSVKWKNTDSAVASISSKTGNSITITKKAKGSTNLFAEVTYTCDDKGNTATASIKTTVFVVDMDDKDTVLKDKSGNTLYVDSKAQTQATLKDYASNSKFYTSPKYTGWQTIDGKVYYYDADHNKVTGKQVIGGVAYTFASDGSLSQSSGNRGIDVSKYQGNIDWGAVASSGINFAIIRAGYRGSSTGVLVEDPYFKRNIAGATKAGIKVGVYFFTQAVTEAEAVEEASMAMSLVSGYKLTYPIFIDTEAASGGRANSLSKSQRTAIVKAFCQTVQNGGYKAGVYASKSWFNNQLNASALSNYCIWVAQYSAECTYSGKHDMWQYTDRGTVSGISGKVDMNISYTGY